MAIPASALPSLTRLRDYMHNFYPELQSAAPLPLEFWKIEDNELFLEALSYLPLMMREVHDEGLDYFPEAYRLAFAIFWLEDDYAFNGWTALTNAGEWLLPYAIFAYQKVGMSSEASALAAALESVRAHPDDDEAAGKAYKSVPNKYKDDEVKLAALLIFFRENSHLFESSRVGS